MHRLPLSLLALAVLTAASPAAGEPLARQGTLGFSADRLFGFSKGSSELERPAPQGDLERDWTGVGFAWQRGVSPFEVPRLGVDYFLGDRLTLGGSVAYASLDDDDDDDDDDASTAFLLAPRVGYAIPFGSAGGFWIRGGLTWHSEGAARQRDGLALTVEPTFWLNAGASGHLLLGFTLDTDVLGEQETPGGDLDHRYTVFGLALGLGFHL